MPPGRTRKAVAKSARKHFSFPRRGSGGFMVPTGPHEHDSGNPRLTSPPVDQLDSPQARRAGRFPRRYPDRSRRHKLHASASAIPPVAAVHPHAPRIRYAPHCHPQPAQKSSYFFHNSPICSLIVVNVPLSCWLLRHCPQHELSDIFGEGGFGDAGQHAAFILSILRAL